MKTNDVEQAVVVPLLQACATGFLACVAVLSGCVLWGWAWAWAGLAGCLVTGVSWLYFRNEHRIRLDALAGVLLPPAEPRVEQPEPARAFTLEIDYDSGRSGDFLTFGVERSTFTSWCEGVANGRPLAEDSWCGAHGLFSKSQYHAFRSELVNRGFMRLRGKHHSQGFELSSKGRALVSGVARTHAHARNTSTNAPVLG